MKKQLAAALLLAASFGMAGMADAASGIVNVQAVLAGSSDFKAANQSVAAERDQLRKEFADKSKNMNDQQKAELAQQYQKQLVEKERAVMGPFNEKLRAAVEKAAREKNVDLVIAAGGIMYGTADEDLTDAVKAEMK